MEFKTTKYIENEVPKPITYERLKQIMAEKERERT